MYGLEQIVAYNDDKASYDALWAVVSHVRSQPIAFGDVLIDDDRDKCAIHIPVFQDDTGEGCGCVPVGTHPSIKSLYDKFGRVICHAEPGARVIDSELARKVKDFEYEFVFAAVHPTKTFLRRYASGSPVEWLYYGRGYCYLQLLIPTVRSRVARILGPFPLVYDVMRFVICFGLWTSQGFFLRRMSGGYLHVESKNWSPGTSLRSILKYSITLKCSDRIGGSNHSVIDSVSAGYVNIFQSAGYSCGLPSVEDVTEFIKSVPRDRVNGIIGWMKVHGLAITDDVVACLIVASSALVALNVTGSEQIRARVRMWQVFGDIVCKHFVAMHVLAINGTVEDYSRLVGKGYQCNKTMSSLVVTSDLYDLCSAQGLDLTSKAWADILEGVIGIIAMTQSANVLRHCLEHFHLIPNSVSKPMFFEFPKVDFPQLNSSEWRRASELFLRGKL